MQESIQPEEAENQLPLCETIEIPNFVVPAAGEPPATTQRYRIAADCYTVHKLVVSFEMPPVQAKEIVPPPDAQVCFPQPDGSVKCSRWIEVKRKWTVEQAEVYGVASFAAVLASYLSPGTEFFVQLKQDFSSQRTLEKLVISY